MRILINGGCKVLRKAVVPYFKVLNLQSAGGIEENHKNPQSWESKPQPRFKLGTS
jgi:hypothetical protein